jgi:hypothetical protein
MNHINQFDDRQTVSYTFPVIESMVANSDSSFSAKSEEMLLYYYA